MKECEILAVVATNAAGYDALVRYAGARAKYKTVPSLPPLVFSNRNTTVFVFAHVNSIPRRTAIVTGWRDSAVLDAIFRRSSWLAGYTGGCAIVEDFGEVHTLHSINFCAQSTCVLGCVLFVELIYRMTPIL